MNKNITICIVTVFLLFVGCTNINKTLRPTSVCQPLSAFDTIIIAPINGDSALVEEEQYRHLPRDIALATTNSLKDQIEDAHIFKKVKQSSDCADHAIKIDAKIYSLIHHRRSFHVGIRGQILNCLTGESIYKFDSDDEQDSEIIKLPGQIADKLVDGIKTKLTCSASDIKKPVASLTVDKKPVPTALMTVQENILKDKIELSERWEKAGTTLNGMQLFIDKNTKSKPSEDIVQVWVKTIANTDNCTDLLEIDCVQRKIKKIDIAKESLAFPEQTNEWKFIVPETASELIFNSVCLEK